MIALLLTLACAGPSTGLDNSGAASSSADGGGSLTADAGGSTTTGGGSTIAGQLYGDLPDKALPAPEFVATNRDGTGRSREDLLGHPTVMWFYPAAGTAG